MKKFETPDVKILPPDTRLRDKIGKNVKLEDIFNSEKIALAQQAIDEARGEFLTRARLFMQQLHLTFEQGCEEKRLAELALTLKAQSGTFGYHLASDVAHRLYHFVHNRLLTDAQKIVIQKHLEALDSIFSHGLIGEGGEQGEALRKELDKLSHKFE